MSRDSNKQCPTTSSKDQEVAGNKRVVEHKGIGLPPDLNDSVRGVVTLRLHALHLRGDPATERTVVRVKWWGEQGHGSLFRLAGSEVVRYPIHSSMEKLAQYFNDAQVLSLEVADGSTRVVLGRALLPIHHLSLDNPFHGWLTIQSALAERTIGDMNVSIHVSSSINHSPLQPSHLSHLSHLSRPSNRGDKGENNNKGEKNNKGENNKGRGGDSLLTFQDYEQMAATDHDSRLPLYPSPVRSTLSRRSPSSFASPPLPPSSLPLSSLPSSAPLPFAAKETPAAPPLRDIGAQDSGNRKETDGVLAELLQRGLRLRDAMANSASSAANTLSLSESTSSSTRAKSSSPLTTYEEPAPRFTSEMADDIPLIDDSLDAVREILAAQDKHYLNHPDAGRTIGDSGMPVLAVVEDPLVRASLLSDIGTAEDALLNDLFFGGNKKTGNAPTASKKVVPKKPKVAALPNEVEELEVPHHKRGIFLHIQAIKTVPTSLFQFKAKRNMYVLCRVYNGAANTTRTGIRWGTRNPTWNHKCIFAIPPDNKGWTQHLASNSMVLEIWDRPSPIPSKPSTVQSTLLSSYPLSVDSSDKLVGIATIPLKNHLTSELLQFASPLTPYPIRDVISGENAGYIFLEASIGSYAKVHAQFKLHAIRILQRTWRKKLALRKPAPISPPKPTPLKAESNKNEPRRTAPIHATPAPHKKQSLPSFSHHISTQNFLPNHATLCITILQARLNPDLLPSKPNIFVVYALPVGIGEPQATSICYSTHNPVWDHSYSTDMVLDPHTISTLHQPNKYITFELWHKYDPRSIPPSNQHEMFLGSASLPLVALFEASQRSNAHICTLIDVFSSPPKTPIGKLELELSLNPSSSSTTDQLTSSHEWVVNTLTNYRQVNMPKRKESFSDGELSDDLFVNKEDTGRATAKTSRRPVQDDDYHGPSSSLPTQERKDQATSITPAKSSQSTPKTNSEWRWTTDLDKELSIQTDVILKNRHAKNMLELDSLLRKLSSDSTANEPTERMISNNTEEDENATEIAKLSKQPTMELDEHEYDDMDLVNKIKVMRNSLSQLAQPKSQPPLAQPFQDFISPVSTPSQSPLPLRTQSHSTTRQRSPSPPRSRSSSRSRSRSPPRSPRSRSPPRTPPKSSRSPPKSPRSPPMSPRSPRRSRSKSPSRSQSPSRSPRKVPSRSRSRSRSRSLSKSRSRSRSRSLSPSSISSLSPSPPSSPSPRNSFYDIKGNSSKKHDGNSSTFKNAPIGKPSSRPPSTRTIITQPKWDAETERIAKILKGR